MQDKFRTWERGVQSFEEMANLIYSGTTPNKLNINS
jgi:hypothetical protein